MIEETRKVQPFGKHSFCVVLPKGWVVGQDIKGHDPIKVFISGHALIIVKPEHAEELRAIFSGGV